MKQNNIKRSACNSGSITECCSEVCDVLFTSCHSFISVTSAWTSFHVCQTHLRAHSCLYLNRKLSIVPIQMTWQDSTCLTPPISSTHTGNVEHWHYRMLNEDFPFISITSFSQLPWQRNQSCSAVGSGLRRWSSVISFRWYIAIRMFQCWPQCVHVCAAGLERNVFRSSCLHKKSTEEFSFGGLTYHVSGVTEGNTDRSVVVLSILFQWVFNMCSHYYNTSYNTTT